MARSGSSTSLTWTLDLENKIWKNMAPETEPYPTSFGSFAGASAYDAKTKLVFLETVEGFQTYNFDTNAWKRLIDFSNKPFWPRYMVYGPKRGAIDSKRRLFWGMGSGAYFIWDIDAEKVVTDSWITVGGGTFDNSPSLSKYPNQLIKTGGGDIITAAAPGIDYDSKADVLVAWKGGSPYVLNLSSKTWAIKSAIGAPSAQVKNGTYGRFRYIEKYNVFILVNRATENIFFYKLTAGPVS